MVGYSKYTVTETVKNAAICVS